MRTSLFVLLSAALLVLVACQANDGPVTPSDRSATGGPSASLERHLPASPFVPGDDIRVVAAQGSGFRGLVPAGGKFVVDDDGLDCKDAGFTTIQAAVLAAGGNPGKDKIEICAGTYPENVVIGPGNELDLKGAGAGSTVVTGGAPTSDPIIHVSGTEVDIEKLTVDGGSTRSGGAPHGIRYDDASGKVKEVEVLNVRNASGGAPSVGIALRSSGAGESKLKVEKSRVENYTRAGILIDGIGADGDVKDNDVTGPAPPTVWAPNGIQVSRGATAHVKHNVVTNNPSPNPPGGGGSGIILLCPAKTKVHGNEILNADLGVSLGDVSGADVHDNEISASNYAAISLQFLGNVFGAGGLGCPGHPAPTANNRVHGNRIEGSGTIDDGIDLVNYDPASIPGTPNDNRIDNNRSNGAGFAGYAVYAGFFGGDNPSGNLFANNEATASGSFSCYDSSTGGGTAGTANVWKNDDGEAPDFPDGICP